MTTTRDPSGALYLKRYCPNFFNIYTFYPNRDGKQEENILGQKRTAY
jgi:hypothetical protein